MNFSAYLNLTKPRISFLFAYTGFATLIFEKSLSIKSFQFWMIVFAIFIVGGGANAFNQYFEREVDSQMARTAKKRSLPRGVIKPRDALTFAIVMSLLGNVMLFIWGNWLACFWGIFTILFYSFYYTMWLKPRTPYNIVIGGAAGATGPFIAWAAASGQVHWVPFILFLIVFLWTPPHFWALALCCKEDYSKVSYPMYPNVYGDKSTRKQILLYSISLLPVTLSLVFFGSGILYLASAFGLSLLFVLGAMRLIQLPSTKRYWQYFGYSIIYLFLLFTILIIDSFI